MSMIMASVGIIGIMLCLGTLLRAKVKAFRNILVPASVIGGLIGCILMNVSGDIKTSLGLDYSTYSEIANNLFTISFISIALTSTVDGGKGSARNVLRGSVGMGIVWSMLFALSALIGGLILLAIGGWFDFNPIYGMMIPYGFAQGPGQAAAIGSIYELYGWKDAAMVALTFAAIGFLIAFGVGVPAARLGIKRKHARYTTDVVPAVSRGYFNAEEPKETVVRDTTHPSNIETLAIHFAVIGLCYVLALGIAKLFSLIPGFFGTSMSGMMFINGMAAGYIVKLVMKRFKLSMILNRDQQTKITNFTSDFLVVAAFMAVSFNALGQWIVPILIISAVVSAATFAVCFYFGQRFGDKNDFERTLGLFGTCTGTVPSGIALVRIVDPRLQTTTVVELGLMNLVMMVSMPATLVLMAYASGTIERNVVFIVLAASVILYLVLLKLARVWKREKSYNFRKQASDVTQLEPESEME